MKETYETPACEVIEFETEDVISTSNPGLSEGGNENGFSLDDGLN